MTEPTLNRNGKPLNAEATPHLSYSRIQKYLTCPEQYRLYYLERLRAKSESAGLVFGSVMHVALAEFFCRERNPVETFRAEWAAVQESELRYPKTQSWELLGAIGEKLLEEFHREEASKITRVFAVEEPFTIAASNLLLPLIGTVDLIAEIAGKRTLVDFKTASSDFEEFEIALADQLTLYALAHPEIEQLAICTLLKSREPRIRWRTTSRVPADAVEYLAKVEMIEKQIAEWVFYKRVGKWCRQCEFLPVCMGNQRKARETIVQLA